jgi:hypothetical protein
VKFPQHGEEYWFCRENAMPKAEDIGPGPNNKAPHHTASRSRFRTQLNLKKSEV